jgi:hypothetical protein
VPPAAIELPYTLSININININRRRSRPAVLHAFPTSGSVIAASP